MMGLRISGLKVLHGGPTKVKAVVKAVDDLSRIERVICNRKREFNQEYYRLGMIYSALT